MMMMMMFFYSSRRKLTHLLTGIWTYEERWGVTSSQNNWSPDPGRNYLEQDSREERGV